MGKSKSKTNPKQIVKDTPSKSDVDSEDSEEVDGDDADDADEIDEITEETLTEEQGEELQVFLRSATLVMGRLNATKKEFQTKQFLSILNSQRAAAPKSSGMAGEKSTTMAMARTMISRTLSPTPSVSTNEILGMARNEWPRNVKSTTLQWRRNPPASTKSAATRRSPLSQPPPRASSATPC